jgi:hypothetical protein
MVSRNKECLLDDEIKKELHSDRLSMLQVILKIIEVVMMMMTIILYPQRHTRAETGRG